MIRNKFSRPGIFILSVDPSMDIEDLKQMVSIAAERFVEHTTIGECTILDASDIFAKKRSTMDRDGEILLTRILKHIGNCNKEEFIGRFMNAVVCGEVDKKTIEIIGRMNEDNVFLKKHNLEFLPNFASCIKYQENSQDVIFSRFL